MKSVETSLVGGLLTLAVVWAAGGVFGRRVAKGATIRIIQRRGRLERGGLQLGLRRRRGDQAAPVSTSQSTPQIWTIIQHISSDHLGLWCSIRTKDRQIQAEKASVLRAKREQEALGTGAKKVGNLLAGGLKKMLVWPPTPCASTASAAKTPPIPCAFTGFATKTSTIPCASTAFAAETPHRLAAPKGGFSKPGNVVCPQCLQSGRQILPCHPLNGVPNLRSWATQAGDGVEKPKEMNLPQGHDSESAAPPAVLPKEKGSEKVMGIPIAASRCITSVETLYTRTTLQRVFV